MKVLHVITSLSTGGAEKLMVDLLPQLHALGCEADLLLFDGTRTPFYAQLEAAGVRILPLTTGGNVYNPLNILRLARHMRRYDIVHTHNTACQLFAPLARLLSPGGPRLVTTEHNTTNRRRGRWYFRLLDRWMYSQYQHIICVSAQTQDNLHHYLPSTLGKTSVIFNGINTQRFTSLAPADTDAPEFVVTMIARFDVQKDQDTLVRAMAELPGRFVAQFAGDGPRRAQVEALAADLGVAGRCRFLGIRGDVPQLLEASHAVALASHWEGLSLSSIEGMASGRPFLASDVDGLREIVRGNGILFADGDAHALANALRRLADDSGHYRRTAEACVRKAAQYDIAPMARQYMQLYKSIRKINGHNCHNTK